MNELKKLNLHEIAREGSRIDELTARLEGKAADATNRVWVESFAASGKPTAVPQSHYAKTLSVTLE